MTYITGDNDTLQNIAARLTLSPSYGEAIARANGLSNDFMTTPVNGVLEPGLALEIPDSWLKAGGASIMDSLTSLTPLQKGIALFALYAAFMLLTTR